MLKDMLLAQALGSDGGSAESDVFILRYSITQGLNSYITVDKPHNEIAEAFRAGKTVLFVPDYENHPDYASLSMIYRLSYLNTMARESTLYAEANFIFYDPSDQKMHNKRCYKSGNHLQYPYIWYLDEKTWAVDV